MYSRHRTARTEYKTSISASGIPKSKSARYVYSPDYSEQAIQQVNETVSHLQAKSPDSVTIITGDFNHNTLENELPLFYQYIDCPTRGKNILDLCYGNIKNVYKCKALLGLGKSDHKMIQLTPKYRTVLKKSKVDKQVVSVWNAENTEMLQDFSIARIGPCLKTHAVTSMNSRTV
ncbi:endonuclease domain of the non-LTR retrotransposon LINE-1 [Elysia marginata]|uniref:Endonuclease domain of the non-LTR retrotransposon LINE-1 n=1 Tax=Elysia marginata TaxID=1093978 RepID=A0AAV4IE28_9GAST|nr:endonuclease domain of the non-LTR retrotransposon LINE-1 [Elysia marginata]